jgi:hypothetical protein
MSPDRGTHGSPLLWFSWNHGRTPFEGSPRILGKGFARLGEAAVGGTDEVPPTPLMWWAVSENWRVPLPAAVQEPFEVYVNGVAQRRGTDYELRGRELVFSKPLAKEGRLGPLRWLSIFLGIAGTYRKNDSVDVVYQAGGQRTVAAALPITPPDVREPG